ncbi:hypothetical protein MSAN_02087000 [Mycena sanguinolenta]|uniref:Uncharacterized protein n=1 Tax=Mycena sanguinolenta TaxID=230812 RepID=A0A8H6XGF6_9AGAR|nr:hypothetical protein MSAN_02087000 [Mycena sanguinolenta]
MAATASPVSPTYTDFSVASSGGASDFTADSSTAIRSPLDDAFDFHAHHPHPAQPHPSHSHGVRGRGEEFFAYNHLPWSSPVVEHKKPLVFSPQGYYSTPVYVPSMPLQQQQQHIPHSAYNNGANSNVHNALYSGAGAGGAVQRSYSANAVYGYGGQHAHQYDPTPSPTSPTASAWDSHSTHSASTHSASASHNGSGYAPSPSPALSAHSAHLSHQQQNPTHSQSHPQNQQNGHGHHSAQGSPGLHAHALVHSHSHSGALSTLSSAHTQPSMPHSSIPSYTSSHSTIHSGAHQQQNGGHVDPRYVLGSASPSHHPSPARHILLAVPPRLAFARAQRALARPLAESGQREQRAERDWECVVVGGRRGRRGRGAYEADFSRYPATSSSTAVYDTPSPASHGNAASSSPSVDPSSVDASSSRFSSSHPSSIDAEQDADGEADEGEDGEDGDGGSDSEYVDNEGSDSDGEFLPPGVRRRRQMTQRGGGGRGGRYAPYSYPGAGGSAGYGYEGGYSGGSGYEGGFMNDLGLDINGYPFPGSSSSSSSAAYLNGQYPTSSSMSLVPGALGSPGGVGGVGGRRPRARPSAALPIPVPVPNLTKKSRGRRVPTVQSLYGGGDFGALRSSPFSPSSSLSSPTVPSISSTAPRPHPPLTFARPPSCFRNNVMAY